jgi:hypothetical protein
MQPIAPTTYEDNRFFGLSTKDDSVNLAPGFVVQCDNFSVEAGKLVSRPGKQGALAATMGAAIYNLTPIKQSDGTTRIWFASNGNLYSFNPAAGTSATQVTFGGMPALASADVVITQAAGYVYVADNSTTGILRFNADGTGGGAYSGLDKPDAPTQVALTSRSFLPSGATVGSLVWTVPTATVTNEIVDFAEHDFPFGSTFWNVIPNGRFGDVFSEFNGRTCAEFDGTGDGVKIDVVQTLTATAGGLYPLLFFVEGEYSPQDPGVGNTNYEGTELTMTVYENADGTGNSEARTAIARVKMDSTDQGARRHVFDFRGGAVPEPKAVMFQWVQMQ